jgi:hypothetical protein
MKENINEGRKPAKVYGGEKGGARMVGSGRTGNPTWTPGKKKEPKTAGQKKVIRTRSKERLSREKAMGKPNLPEAYQALGRYILQEMEAPSDSEIKKTAKKDAKENKKKGSPEDREFAGKVKKAMGKKKIGQGIDNLKRDIRAAGERGKKKLDREMQAEASDKKLPPSSRDKKLDAKERKLHLAKVKKNDKLKKDFHAEASDYNNPDNKRARKYNQVKREFGALLKKHKGDAQAARKESYAKKSKKVQKTDESYGKGHDEGMKASKGAKSNKEQISKYLKARKKAGGKEKGSLADVKTGLVGKTRK